MEEKDKDIRKKFAELEQVDWFERDEEVIKVEELVDYEPE